MEVRAHMKNSIRTIAAAAALFALPASGAQAITNGTATTNHDYVGALVSHDDTGRYLICTGTLISPTVFMTAAHCLVDEPTDYLEVSFDSFVGAPDVGPDVTLHRGTPYGHPAFEDETAPGDTHDIAVIVLDEPVKGVKTAKLPSKNALTKLARRDVLDELRFGVVGYGREGYDAGSDEFFGGGGKRSAFTAFDKLEDFKLFNDQTGSTGGTCRGDSGGPVFLGAGRVVVGIVSDGDETCMEHGVNYRTDTKSARSFLKPFLKSRDDD